MPYNFKEKKQFLLVIPKDLHAKLKDCADAQFISMHAFILQAIDKSVEEYLERKEARRGPSQTAWMPKGLKKRNEKEWFDG